MTAPTRRDGAGDDRPWPLVDVEGLEVHYPVRGGPFSRLRGRVRAVDGVSFSVEAGRTLGLVGESGSGKSTTGRALLRLVEPTAGVVRFDGEDVGAMDEAGLRRLRRRAQIIFQDPFASLNPRLTVGSALRESLRVHGLARGRRAEDRVRELLDRVGLASGSTARYPHELSGGQRQRVGIARALSVEPEFLVCDEPVSALDVSVQAQVVNLLDRLQSELGLAYLFIAHDLGVVRHVSDRIAVMYLGRIVEVGDAEAVTTSPRHPYTRALLSSVPSPDPGQGRSRIVLQGETPSSVEPPSGCPFHPRCPHPAKDVECTRGVPPLSGNAGSHRVACIKEAPVSGGRGTGSVG